MKTSTAKMRPFTRADFARANQSRVKRYSRRLAAAAMLLFAGNAHAVIEVGLAIENDLDQNGNITVINGSRVSVAYTVIEDTDNDLNKKDKIQLLRVDDDSIVDQVERGKKKTGTVSLQVNESEAESLYVRYVRKGKAATEITRVSHPDDPDYTPLLSIARANTADLTIGLNAANEAMPGIEFYSNPRRSNLVDTTNPSTEVARVEVSVPGPGFIDLSFVAVAEVDGDAYSFVQCYIRLGTDPVLTSGAVGIDSYMQATEAGQAGRRPLAAQGVYTHAGGATTLTFTVNCRKGTGNTAGSVGDRSLIARYFPRRL